MAETPGPIQLAQLARLLGAAAEDRDVRRLRALLDERLERLTRGLLEEAVASDDVVDAASAAAYLEDRLAFFGGLLSEGQRGRVKGAYMQAVRRWDAPPSQLT
jgi:hypothetical protein